MTATLERIEVSMEDLEKILERAGRGPLSQEDRDTLRDVFLSYFRMTELLDEKGATIRKLRKLLFGSTTEKTEKLFDGEKPKEDDAEGGRGEEGGRAGTSPGEEGEPQKKKPRGHGRNGAEAYVGAETIRVPHATLHPGDGCLECPGKVYKDKTPSRLVRIVGQPPLQATVYELERYRCNLCGAIFTAEPPEGVGREKYDATSAAMIGLLKYGSGLPFNRLEGLQGSLGVPLPASTQWEVAEDAGGKLLPVFDEHIRQAAQGEVVHNDDTTARILSLMEENEKRTREGKTGNSGKKPRTGMFTSGIVSTVEGKRIALFLTGRQHAGENLADVLARRGDELDAPIQMCDALSRNLPGELEVIVANCIAHGRRQFVDVVGNFPDECRYVLDELAKVYEIDAQARERGLSKEERLALHQAESGPVMERLETWFTGQLEERRVEPNSGLGKAITYMLQHWEKLTRFLQEPGAPLDNNICERALKKSILHRKNALFYKTENGARVGDIFMSLIHTCELSGANPFDYLTELLRHHGELARDPAAWMPWNYRETLERLAAQG
jgi:transposase